jgi:hypothetical protein
MKIEKEREKTAEKFFFEVMGFFHRKIFLIDLSCNFHSSTIRKADESVRLKHLENLFYRVRFGHFYPPPRCVVKASRPFMTKASKKVEMARVR